MDVTPVDRMRTLFGLNPDVMPAGLRFPRLPPGLMHPMTSGFSIPDRRTAGDAASLTPSLEDFQQMYQRHASGLLESDNPGIVPPSHPLYTRRTSVGILRFENEKLVRENLELKKRLDSGSTPRPGEH